MSPRYLVIEKRSLRNAIIIEAEDEQAAKDCKGEILDENETDTWADELLSIEEVDDDVDEVPERAL
jgi:hypothetical protein